MAETGPQTITSAPKRTLGLAGITIHAMTLIAPGAFVWLIFPLQLSISSADIWPGVVLALSAALLTSLGFSSLAARYPEAGTYSAYHFILRIFSDPQSLGQRKEPRALKLLAGWAAHLFYWTYPGVLIAFMTALTDYVLRQFGYHPTIFGKVLLAAGLAAFIGFLGLRGIRGSMSSSILLNVLQIVIVTLFSSLAIAYRLLNPASPAEWLYSQPAHIFLPQSGLSLLIQASVSIFLVIGFEAVVSLGVAAANPRRDIPRGTILALLIQGFLAYSVQYFAFNFAMPARGTPLASILSSPAPLGDLAMLIGDRLLAGNGFTLMVIVASSVMTAALAASLTAINTAVRSTFAMSLDPFVPEVLSLLPDRFATPYHTVVLVAVFSGLVAVLGVLGGVSALLGITLAANLGAFLLYGLICGLSALVEFDRKDSHSLWKSLLGLGGLLINLVLFAVTASSAFGVQSTLSNGARIAFGFAFAWLAFSFLYYALRKRAA